MEKMRADFNEIRSGRSLETTEVGEKRLPDIAAQGQSRKLAFALDGNEASGLKLVEMMGKRRGGDGQAFAHIGACSTVVTGTEALDDFHAARVAQGFENRHALACR